MPSKKYIKVEKMLHYVIAQMAQILHNRQT